VTEETSAAGPLHELVRLIEKGTHTSGGDVEKVAVVAGAVGDSLTNAAARLVDHDSQRGALAATRLPKKVACDQRSAGPPADHRHHPFRRHAAQPTYPIGKVAYSFVHRRQRSDGMVTDRYGLPLTTSPTAATAYGEGVDRLLRLDQGAAEAFRRAVTADPGFALAHSALALLAYEAGAGRRAAFHLAQAEARSNGASRRELSSIACFRLLVQAQEGGDRRGARARLLHHLRDYPTDAVILTVAFPTIAFCGVTETASELWPLLEALAPEYGDDWFYLSLMAFVRQEQGRYEEAFALAELALEQEPHAGHAVHARAHAEYQSGHHREGLAWLNAWLATTAGTEGFRGHAQWHAALHELCLGDYTALRYRWETELAPPRTSGVRVLIDAGSLLARRAVQENWGGPPPLDTVLDAVDQDLLESPPSPFCALNAALVLAAAGEVGRLQALLRHAANLPGPWQEALLPVVAGLLARLRGDAACAAGHLGRALPRLARLGGSAAQREAVIEELFSALIDSGQEGKARALADAHLDHRRVFSHKGEGAEVTGALSLLRPRISRGVRRSALLLADKRC
jgi:tetratricopeptide (TPR) repeat protein